jgi:hypothetical protein
MSGPGLVVGKLRRSGSRLRLLAAQGDIDGDENKARRGARCWSPGFHLTLWYSRKRDVRYGKEIDGTSYLVVGYTFGIGVIWRRDNLRVEAVKVMVIREE